MARNTQNDIYVQADPLEVGLDFSHQLIYLNVDELSLSISLNAIFTRENILDGSKDLNLNFNSDFYIQYSMANWVKWGKIGEFDFTIDRTNLAGEMPVDWAGEIYSIGKLDKSLIVYGSYGISVLTPISNVFSKTILLSIGVKSPGAILLSRDFHLFISTDGCLWKLTDKLERLGYEEFLNPLTNPVISYDVVNRMAYICDGTYGYAFNCESHSMGAGPNNITGIGYYDGAQYVMASGTITPLDTYITTHQLDFNNRNFKSILEVEVGGEFSSDLMFGVSYRNNSTQTFSTPIWFSVTSEGRVFPNFFAKEFQLHLTTEEDIRLDYLRIKGLFADFNPIDA